MRSFFCDVYGGAMSNWCMPHLFLTKIYSPFLDRRLLDYIASWSPGLVSGHERHGVYNLLFENHFPELNDIPTNSTLGKWEGNCISFFSQGKDRKELPTESLPLHVIQQAIENIGDTRLIINKDVMKSMNATFSEMQVIGRRITELSGWRKYIHSL